MSRYVASIDQGTTSTRCLLFDRVGQVVAVEQKEHRQIFPRAGWVEHDPVELWHNTREVCAGALARADLAPGDVVAVGIANQRETTVVWDRATGEPVYNAIVWQDTRTDKICADLAGDEGPDRFRSICGLPIASYFSGPKVMWIFQNVDGVRERAERGEVLFGNMDCWLLWNLTGGTDGGLHVTDPTNASRTMLMNLETLDWDDSILEAFGIPRAMLPEIRSSSEVYGDVKKGPLAGAAHHGRLQDRGRQAHLRARGRDRRDGRGGPVAA